MGSLSREEKLLKEYEILVDIIKFQHERVRSWDNTFLAANMAVLAIASWASTKGQPLLLGVICAIGLGLCLVWLLCIMRLHLDTNIRWRQLCGIERSLAMPRRIFAAAGAYMKGVRGRGQKKIRGPETRRWERLPLRYANVVIAGIFILVYVGGITLIAAGGLPVEPSEHGRSHVKALAGIDG